MALVDQARFYDAHGLSPQELSNALAEWFRYQGFEWRTSQEPGSRYTLQICKQSTGRAILGLNFALTVSFTPQTDGRTLVELGGADWTDKIVSGAIGVLLIAPLMLTAGYGAWQQSELNNRVWEFLDGYIFQRTGQYANAQTAVPYYNGMPGYNSNVPPPQDAYYPSVYYPQPGGSSGFPPPPGQPSKPSWFDAQTMQPVFSQQIERMASWQQAIADGKIVDEEVKEQTEKVEKMRKYVEDTLDADQKLKLAEVLAAMDRLEAAQIAAGQPTGVA